VTEYQKLTSYFGERQRSGGAFVADALLELYGRHEIAASILLRGTEGFGLKHHLRTDRSLSLSEDLPLVAVAVDTRPRIEAVLGPARALTSAGLVTVEGARLLADTAVAGPDEATKLTVYLGRQERVYRVPAFVAVCDLLHRRGIDGATTLLGIWGVHGDHAPHGDRLLQLGRHVPTVTVVIDTSERIAGAYGIIDELTSERGLVTCETIRSLEEIGSALRAAGPPWR
jgi:PII-like signaling protein